MRPGYRTTEFWLAAHWMMVATGSAAHLLLSPPATWTGAVATAVAVGTLVYFAGVINNNYSENRFLQKSAGRLKQQGRSEEEETRPAFGFGRFIEVETEEGEQDDDG